MTSFDFTLRPMKTEPGTYALLLRAEQEQSIDVGALGELMVDPATYVYVGSAFGPGGLRARVHRHARNDGTRHWHVDYLRAVTELEAVWYTHDEKRRECEWAMALRTLPGMTVPLHGFGASDCSCPGHLILGEGEPDLFRFRDRVRSAVPSHAPIFRTEEEIRLSE